MQAITKVFSDIVKPYIDATDNGLIDNDFTNGAVNMLPNTATSQTINSVEWTVNSDGTVQAYVPSGTTTSSESNLIIATPDKMNALLNKYGEIKVVGCPAGGSDFAGGYGIRCKQGTKYPRDNGNGVILKSSDGTVVIGLSCNVRENTTGPITLLFKPMIGLVSTPNFDYAHYVPYAKSNRELTEDVSNTWIDESFGQDTISVTADGTKTYKTLLNELAAAVLAKAQGLESGRIMEMVAFDDEGDFNWAMPLRPVYLANNASSFSSSFMGTSAASDSSANIKSVTVHTTLNSCYMGRTMVTTTGNTFTNFLSLVPTSGKKMFVFYKIHRVIY